MHRLPFEDKPKRMEITLSLVRLDKTTLAAYGSELVYILTHPSMESFRDNEHIVQFLNMSNRYSQALGITPKSNEPLRKLDRNRDRAFLRLRYLIVAAHYSPSEEDVRKAKLLMGVIKSCGNRINAKRDMQETEDIHLLLLRLANEDAARAIEELELKDALAELERTQKLFNDASARKITYKDEVKQMLPSSIRKEYEAAIREIWSFVEAMKYIAPSEAWTRALANIEAKNKEYRAKLKHQKTFRDKRKEKNAESSSNEATSNS